MLVMIMAILCERTVAVCASMDFGKGLAGLHIEHVEHGNTAGNKTEATNRSNSR